MGAAVGLEDLWDTVRGPVGVLGNGPSLLTHSIGEMPTVTIGVNRAPLWGVTTWWLTADSDWAAWSRPVDLGIRRAVIQDYAPAGVDLAFRSTRLPLYPGRCETLAFARLGLLHCGQSSIKPAIHLALIMGATEIHVYGVDGGGPRIDGTTGDERVQEGYRMVSRWLDDVVATWKGRVEIVRHA